MPTPNAIMSHGSQVAKWATTSILTLILTTVALLALASPASAAVRLKELADVQGVRDNDLFGYGLVVGLNGSGDT